jgi:hypothetical protein
MLAHSSGEVNEVELVKELKKLGVVLAKNA